MPRLGLPAIEQLAEPVPAQRALAGQVRVHRCSFSSGQYAARRKSRPSAGLAHRMCTGQTMHSDAGPADVMYDISSCMGSGSEQYARGPCPRRRSRHFDAALVSADFVRDPYPLLDVLREREPVYWSESLGAWVLTRYHDVSATFKDVGTYSNEGRLARAAAYLPEPRSELTAFDAHYKTKGLLHSDPPDHTRMRRVISRRFSPRVVDRLRPRIQQIVDQLIDSVEPAGTIWTSSRTWRSRSRDRAGGADGGACRAGTGVSGLGRSAAGFSGCQQAG